MVWKALNEPEVLKACIPGCEELDRTSDTTFEGKVKQKIGPVNARFNIIVELSDIVEAQSYRISGEGKGGAAGFAKGGAAVRLEDEGEGTLLSYDAEAKVGGKLAQLGSRLIDGYARKMSDEFFDRFKRAVEPPEEGDEESGQGGGQGGGAESGGTTNATAGAAEAAKPDAPAAAENSDDSGKKKGWFRRLFG